MKFKGLTKLIADYKAAKAKRLEGWHEWFAWYPVPTVLKYHEYDHTEWHNYWEFSGEFIWLQKVSRKVDKEYYDRHHKIQYIYKEIPDEFKSSN